MAFPYIAQGNNITVVIGTNSHTINRTHIAFSRVLEAIKAGDWDTVKDIIEPQKVVLNYGAGHSCDPDVSGWVLDRTHGELHGKSHAEPQQAGSD